MTVEDIIRTQMTAAGMLMEDLPAKVVLDPLGPGRTRELRELAEQLTTIANVVDAVRRA